MRRPSLSTKLLAAAVPLLLAIGALLFVNVRADLDKVADAERSAQLGAVWSPMIDALAAVEAERDLTADTAAAIADEVPPDSDTAAPADQLAAARTATDTAIATVRTAIEDLGENVAAVKHITSARSSLSAARRNLDMAAANMVMNAEPFAAYGLASSELVAVAGLLPPAAGDPVLGRQLLAVEKIAESNLAAGLVIQNVSRFTDDPTNTNALVAARNSLDQLESALSEFEVIAPDEWASQFRRSGMTIGFASFRIDVDRALRSEDPSAVEPIEVDAFSTLITQGNDFQREISTSIVERAEAEAASTRSATLVRMGIILGAVLLAMIVTWWITRSIAKRVRAVAAAANQVATRQLPTLVHAMRDPRGRALPTIDPVNAKGSDELAELAESFNTMQRTLVSVAEEQVAVLRKGVSDIFINMARRNRSLVDRQLSMLDGFEAEVNDPDVLANYYQLDHLATRMRRNAESLLVLANEEPRRRRTGPTDVDNVVRASIGEIEEYRRIQVEHLDNMKVRGNVVADVAHLFAELLDNAASFSPPNSTVRVGGRRSPDGYTVRINDAGVGINPDRLEELNELLQNPPIVGLSVEPTLGMSVVSLLAAKHGIKVTLRAGAPGLTVDVELPMALSAEAPTAMESGPAIGAGDSASAGAAVAAAAPAPAPAPAPSASAGLRIDDAVVAQFAAGQGPQLTSASVNDLGSSDGSNFAMPNSLDGTVNGTVPETVNGYGTDGAADGHDGHDDSTFVLPETFGLDSYAVTIDEAPAAPAPANHDDSTFTMPGTDAGAAVDAGSDRDSMFTMPVSDVSTDLDHGTQAPVADEPMFQPVPLNFGVSREAGESPASSDDFEAQLDRPNLSARLTDAFQRSNLGHTPSAANAAEAAATAAAAAAAAAEVTTSADRVEDAPVYAEAATVADVQDAPAAPSPVPSPAPPAPSAAAVVKLPPPPSAQPHGEFSRPLSPPASASGPTSQPVTPADAHPAPRIVTRPPAGAPLPTRRASEVDGGPDRLADLPSTVSGTGVSIDEEAGALAAALAAFDRRLDNHHASNGNGHASNGNGTNGYSNGNGDGHASNGNGHAQHADPVDTAAAGLPTRSRAAVTTPMSNYDDRPESTTTSKLDPEQLRERLRSFQTGVHTAIAPAPETTLDADSELGENR